MSKIQKKHDRSDSTPSPLERVGERLPASNSRRNFIKVTGATAIAGLTGIETLFAATKKKSTIHSGKGLQLRLVPYDLQLRHTFTLANSSRKNTPDVLTCLEFEGITGYGEASMPPYLGESIETATKFLSALNLNQFKDPFLMDDILRYVDSAMPGNCAAKAAVQAVNSK